MSRLLIEKAIFKVLTHLKPVLYVDKEVIFRSFRIFPLSSTCLWNACVKQLTIWNFLLLTPFAFPQSSLRCALFSPFQAGLSPFWGPKALMLCTIWSFGTRSGKKPLSITVIHSCLLFGVQLCKLFLICSARKVSGVFKSRNQLTWIYTIWYRS